MQQMNSSEWDNASKLYAFLGNSLLTPIRRTEHVGLAPEFWESIGTLFDGAIEEPAQALAAYARARECEDEQRVLQDISVEFTHLFVGPPAPAASPWETTNGEVPTSVGFGEATFDMRRRLREVGLSVQNENHQYEDHMGIELLYVSVLCKRVAAREGASEDVCEFITAHPLAWIEHFKDKVAAAAPSGYYQLLLELAIALMTWQVAALSAWELS